MSGHRGVVCLVPVGGGGVWSGGVWSRGVSGPRGVSGSRGVQSQAGSGPGGGV